MVNTTQTMTRPRGLPWRAPSRAPSRAQAQRSSRLTHLTPGMGRGLLIRTTHGTDGTHPQTWAPRFPTDAAGPAATPGRSAGEYDHNEDRHRCQPSLEEWPHGRPTASESISIGHGRLLHLHTVARTRPRDSPPHHYRPCSRQFSCTRASAVLARPNRWHRPGRGRSGEATDPLRRMGHHTDAEKAGLVAEMTQRGNALGVGSLVMIW